MEGNEEKIIKKKMKRTADTKGVQVLSTSGLWTVVDASKDNPIQQAPQRPLSPLIPMSKKFCAHADSTPPHNENNAQEYNRNNPVEHVPLRPLVSSQPLHPMSPRPLLAPPTSMALLAPLPPLTVLSEPEHVDGISRRLDELIAQGWTFPENVASFFCSK